MASLMTPLNAA